MEDRQSALLTKSQREFIQDRQDETSDKARKQRGRIRDRVYTSLEIDGNLLTEINPEERRKIFRDWENRNYETHPSPVDIPKDNWIPDNLEKHGLRNGIAHLLRFIYLGVEEGSLGPFEELLKWALEEEYRKRGETIDSLTIELETSRLLTLEELAGLIEEGELSYGELTPREFQQLVEKGFVELEDVPTQELEEFIKTHEFIQRLRGMIDSGELEDRLSD